MSDRAWNRLQISPFHQDSYGWEDPKTGEYYEPTWAWTMQFIGERTDGELFYVGIIVPNEELASGERAITCVASRLQQGLVLMEEFRTCDCTARKPCEKHAR